MMNEELSQVQWKAIWNGIDTTGTYARYRHILRTFADWVEVRYGTRAMANTLTDEAFADEVIARYQVHCSARLSKSSVRRINAALRIFKGTLATIKKTPESNGQTNDDTNH